MADPGGSRSMSNSRGASHGGQMLPQLRAVEGMTDAELTNVIRAGLGKLDAPILK